MRPSRASSCSGLQRRIQVIAATQVLGLLVFAALTHAATPAATAATHGRADLLPLERPDDPQVIPAPPSVSHGTASPATVVTFGRFTHRQVNVYSGVNVVGDAANEPSIAVDPTNHNRMAIGWRQFDTISSNFRQAGFAYTFDGGGTWTAGKIQSGVFRSDPVLGVDDAGRFLYLSLFVDNLGNITAQFFPSTDGGATWGAQVQAYGGDKSWMTVDRTGGPGNRFAYQAWSTAGNNYLPNTFNRSTNDGVSFQSPTLIDNNQPPIWGTLDLDDNDSLFVGGMDPNTGLVIMARSPNASNSLVNPPTFTVTSADLGGFIMTGPPNPAGLDGQVWVAVDHSPARRGWIYVLASVQTPTDPLDVMFTRSTDGGKTFSPPVRVNDDVGKNWQWFGTMSVAPNGRIDAVWNDSRLTGDSTQTALYYSSSFNGGVTWTKNEQASPIWNCMLGFPSQSKIGDYYQMISDNTGADLAWANTFNNEEDIYYCRLTPNTTGVAPEANRPVRLLPGAPNPFATGTNIRFDVPASGARVKLEILDPAGHRVTTLTDGFFSGGSQTVRWNGTDAGGRLAPSGLYFCRYQAAGETETQKLMLIR